MSDANPTTQGDWRDVMVQRASRAGTLVSTRARSRNPLVPDNFLDVSGAGFPSDLMVMPVQIPRAASPAEQQQYRNLVNAGWLHVPWEAISENGGADGKADVPAALRHDLGGGEAVATLAGHYLMFADRKQYENRRAENLERANRRLQHQLYEREEDGDAGRMFASSAEASGPMTIEELLEYEQRLGDEPSRVGK